jgi:hemerythrin superfamily protein
LKKEHHGGTAAKERTMNAIDLLKQDHQEARRGFEEIEAAEAPRRGALWAKLAPELKAHEKREEEALYGPVAREAGSQDAALQDWQAHHQEEVEEAEELIQEIGGLDSASEEWMERVEELRQMLEHHIEEEEGEAWPRIQEAWGEAKLEQAGQQMETLKRRAKSRAA